jgi:molybdopterin-containing oxidoreductase family iron-sulfur binding subunit
LQGDLTPDGHAELRKTWQSLDENAWRQALELALSLAPRCLR